MPTLTHLTNAAVLQLARDLLRVTPLDSQPLAGQSALRDLDTWVTRIESDARTRTSEGETLGFLEACRRCTVSVNPEHSDWKIRDRIAAARDALSGALRAFDRTMQAQRVQRLDHVRSA